MNKAIAATLTAALLLSMGTTTAFAAATNSTVSGDATKNAQTGTTTVKYAVTAGYTWSVPSEIDFGTSAGIGKTVDKTDSVSVSDCIIPDGQELKITVKGSGTENAFVVKNGSTELGYTIKVGDASNALTVGGTVLEVNAGTATGTASLKYTLSTTTGSAEVAGSYTGTATYTAEVVDVAKN